MTLLTPPVGVRLAVQLGRDGLLPPTRVTREQVVFEIPVELVATSTSTTPLRGAAVQGPAHGRFLYVNSGTRAGDPTSPWNRRAKIPLTLMPALARLVAAADSRPTLDAQVAGTAKDGGPAVASIPLLRGWTLAAATG